VSVLTHDSRWEELLAGIPQRIRHLLARCLEGDPKRRLRDIGEARIAIDGYVANRADGAPPTKRRILHWVVTAAFEPFLRHYPRTAQVDVPDCTARTGEILSCCPSPDCHVLAFTGFEPADERRLWMRRSIRLVPRHWKAGGRIAPLLVTRQPLHWVLEHTLAEEGGCGVAWRCRINYQ
jgi:hypothetical protein